MIHWLLLVLLVFFTSPSISYAQSPTVVPTVSPTVFPTIEPTLTSGREGRRINSRACEAQIEIINKIALNTTKRVELVEDTFGKILDRVKLYYTEKVQPSGRTVSNYNLLVNLIDAKKLALDQAVETLNASAGESSCTDTNPGKSKQSVRQGVKKVQGAIKEYKTSIRNLIVAVHSSSSGSERPLTSLSLSPSVIISPTTTP